MNESKLDISNDFQGISDEQWKLLVEKDLKGKNFEDTLVWKNDNGISLQPYYRASDLDQIQKPERFRAIQNEWVIQQDFIVKEGVNASILASLERGATGIGLILQENADLSAALQGVYIDAIPLEISGNVSSNTLKQLVEIASEKNVNLDTLSGVVAFKPLAVSAEVGSNQSLDLLAESIKAYSNQLPNVKLIQIDASPIKNAGGNEHQEIAFALAQVNEYIDRLSEKGIDVQLIVDNLSYKFSFGTSYFSEIAKVRAFRFLVGSIYKSYDVQSDVQITASTATINYAAKDSYTNLLRATTSAMSAVIGGCDRLVILPHDVVFTNQTQFGERVARNIQIVLQEEAHLSKVKDAAAGAYYIEQLSDDLAKKSWELFQEIEAIGGFTLALSQNKFQELVALNAAQVLSLLKDKKRILVGVNKYEPAKSEGKQIKEPIKVIGKDYNALNPIRWSAIFEVEENI